MKTRLPASDPQTDPRRSADRSDLSVASLSAMPAVAAKSTLKDSLVLAGGIMGAVSLGALTLVFLNNGRQASLQRQAEARQQPPLPPANPNGTAFSLPPQPLPEAMPLPLVPAPPGAVVPPAAAAADNSTRAGALVYDVSGPDSVSGPAQATDAKAATNVFDGNNVTDLTGIDGNRQARASRIENPAATVSQGTLIPAVLETALNSDLPGYTRALVSRDVRGFNGTRVLIPRGSRLVGSYRSGLQSGQKRLFITWTRLIRPDGTTITLSDPSTDNLGQAGQTGEVDNHFFKRFGSAMLLSIVGGLASSASSGDSNTIVIGTAQGANNAATAALQADSKISPTVKVAQGTPIQVFVSRDLDFSM